MTAAPSITDTLTTWREQGAAAFRSMHRASGYGQLSPITIAAADASRHYLPASTAAEDRAEWCAGFDEARATRATTEA